MAIDECDDDNESTISSSNTCCSDDTNEAFLEMLGLSSIMAASIMAAAADEGEDEDCSNDGDVTEATSSSSSKSREEEEVEKTKPPPSSSRTDHQTSSMHPARPAGSIIATSPLRVPHRCSRYLHRPSDVAAFMIDDLLDGAECAELIRLATRCRRGSDENTGFRYVTEASHTDDDGVHHVVKLHEANKHKLSVFDHPPTVDTLWRKMKPVIAPCIESFVRKVGCGPPLGLNPRLRVLRYDAEDRDVFEPHFDATTRAGNGYTSLMTVLIYLNDGGGKDFEGGETCYMDHHVSSAKSLEASSTTMKITPAKGRVVVFEHDLFHSSAPLKFGTKFVLRTDVLFELPKDAGNSVNGLGTDRPRRGPAGSACNDIAFETNDADCCTLMEVCRRIALPNEEMLALDGIGLLDLTLDSLFAPGFSAVKQMMQDVLDEQWADRLMKAALASR